MYQQLIREALAALGRIGRYQPHHVEGWMRAEHGTLDHLDRRQFQREVAAAAACIDAAGLAESEAVANSYGVHQERA